MLFLAFLTLLWVILPDPVYNSKLVTKLVDLERDIALIPNLAIHMDRSQNEGKTYDPKTDLLPLIGAS